MDLKRSALSSGLFLLMAAAAPSVLINFSASPSFASPSAIKERLQQGKLTASDIQQLEEIKLRTESQAQAKRGSIVE